MKFKKLSFIITFRIHQIGINLTKDEELYVENIKHY